MEGAVNVTRKGEMRNYVKFQSGYMKEREQLEDIGIDGKYNQNVP